MAYCSRCGVEVEAGVGACPLCGAPIQRLDEAEPETPRYPAVVRPAGRQVRLLTWMVSTVVLLSAALTFVGLDVVLNHRFSWSLYPVTGAGVLWIFLTLVVLLARRPIFVIVGQAIATAGFLVLIDLFDGRLGWFMPLGLPIVAVVTGATLLVWLAARLSRRSPAMITAAVLLGCGAGSVLIDLLSSAHIGPLSVSWSLIVLGAVAPPVAFLLYFHYRLRSRIDLARLLHA